jgi:hypothetical protein
MLPRAPHLMCWRGSRTDLSSREAKLLPTAGVCLKTLRDARHYSCSKTCNTFAALVHFLIVSAHQHWTPQLLHSNNQNTMEPSPAFNVLTAEARDLQKWLQSGSLRSVDLVEAYVQQIQKHNAYLHAVISTVPKDLLLRSAQSLDDERLAHKVRSPLHGIPILLKVSTSPTQYHDCI